MAIRKTIPTSRRAAIWKAHECRCIYCTELVEFANLDVDHILPLSLTDSPELFKQIKIDYGLSSNFDIDSLYNLVPSHRHCNLRKRGEVLNRNRAIYFLSIAENKEEKARSIEHEIKRRLEKDSVSVLMHSALDMGLVTFQEMTSILNDYFTDRDIFRVTESLLFREKGVDKFFSNSDVEMLYEKRLLPRPNGLDKLEMMRQVAGTTKTIEVTTCRQWAEAVRDGFFTHTTYGMKEETVFRRMYAIVQSLAQAESPKCSYITQCSIGIGNYELLPITILPFLSEEGEVVLEELSNQKVTMSDLVEIGRVKILEKSQSSIHIRFDGMGLLLTEIFRADISRDGIEDILVGNYQYSVEGTYGSGGTLLLTRIAPDKPFCVLRGSLLEP